MPTATVDIFCLAQDHLGETLDVGRLRTGALEDLRTEAFDTLEDEATQLPKDQHAALNSIVAEVKRIEAEMGAETFSEDDELIRENCFQEYAEQLAEDLGAIDGDAKWPMSCIDWPRAARELQHDYSAIQIAGATYFFRS